MRLPLTSLGDRLLLRRLGPDLATLQRLLELTLGERGEGVEGLPGQWQLGELFLRQLPVGEMDRDQPARLVVAERHPFRHPILEPGRIQRPGLGEQFTDTEAHPVDRRVHLVLDLLQP